jgi:hypothetical protein
MNKPKKIKHLLFTYNATIVLLVLFIIFFAYSIFIALHTNRGIIPDEVAHFAFSEHYAQTWGIPEDTEETYIYGWYIKQNPFLFYWFNARALNILNLVMPTASDWQLLVFLRLLSSIYALGTVIFCFLLSKEIIKNKWYQLLPVFLLTNTLMFVFLSGGINYDNLANLFCMAGLYYLVKVFNGKGFLVNTLGWMISICLGTLVKYPILPLALAMGIVWLVFTIRNRKTLFPLTIKGPKLICLSLVLIALIIGNIEIYGVNFVKYHSITPACSDLLTKNQCDLSPFEIRYKEYGLDHKLTVMESIRLGYPNPLKYVFDDWIPAMLDRIFGILAHRVYYPSHIMIFYRLLIFWSIILAVRYVKKTSFLTYGLVGLCIFYSLVLVYTNYNSELTYGFKHIALQGRYIFPVIGIVYALTGKLLENVPNKTLRILTLLFTLALFFAGGPIKFIIHYNTIFQGWFV